MSCGTLKTERLDGESIFCSSGGLSCCEISPGNVLWCKFAIKIR